MISGIYCIENKINQKKYIGQSKDISERWVKHVRDLNNGVHHNIHLQASWDKYGEKNFDFKIIKACKPLYLNRFEKIYINIYDTYNNGYNMTTGGDINPMNMPEIRNKIAVSMTGEKNHFYGKNHSLSSEIEMSYHHNTTGYFRVSKEKGNYKQGFRWRYQYFDKEGKKRAIKSIDIDKLKQKVLDKNLPWIEFNPT